MVEYNGKEFNDPIVRCTDCLSLVHRIYISKKGGCHHCGNRRMKNVLTMKPEEMSKIIDGSINFELDKKDWWPMDPAFLGLFEEDVE